MAHATSEEEFLSWLIWSVVLLKGIKKKYASKSVLSCRVCPPPPHSEELKKGKSPIDPTINSSKNQSVC